MLWATFLLILSFALIAAEVFFPSFGALGTGAVLCLIGSIGMAFQEGQTEGTVFVVFALLGGIGSIAFARRVLPKLPFGRKFFLIGEEPTAEQRRAVDPANAALLGKRGFSRSFLRPSGIAEIEGRRIDVMSQGEPIPENASVRVIGVDGNRVVVEVDSGAGSSGKT